MGTLRDIPDGDGTIGIYRLGLRAVDHYRIAVEIERIPIGDDCDLEATVGGDRQEGDLTSGERQERNQTAK